MGKPYTVVRLGRDGLHTVRVPDDQVRVRSHCNATFPGVKVEDLGCVGAGHSHKLVLIHLPSDLWGTEYMCMCTHARRCTHAHREGGGQKAEGGTCSAIKKHMLTSNALWDFPFKKDRHRSGLLVNESHASLAF